MKSKNIRLEKIRRFIRDHEVGTQEEIVEHLKEEGISATQATVSRDIKELGIVKRPLKDMTYVYELPRKHHQGIGMIESNILSHRRFINFFTGFIKALAIDNGNDKASHHPSFGLFAGIK